MTEFMRIEQAAPAVVDFERDDRRWGAGSGYACFATTCRRFKPGRPGVKGEWVEDIVSHPTCWVTLSANDEGDGDEESVLLSLTVESDTPGDHWLAHVLDTESIGEWLQFGTTAAEQVSWLTENGIAPEQLFVAELTLHASRDSWTGESDVEVEWRVMDVEPLTDAEVLTAWTYHLMQTALVVWPVGGLR